MSVKVVQRKDRPGTWQVFFYDQEGKRQRPSFRSKNEALNFQRRVMLGEASLDDKNHITLDVAIKEYYEAESVNKSPSSRSGEKRHFNLMFHFMTTQRGVTRLKDVSLQDLEAFQRWLVDTKEFEGGKIKMSASTVNRAFNSIRDFFKKHVQWGHIQDSPCRYLDNLQFETNERRPMTHEEYAKALEAMPKWYLPAFAFIHYTGQPASVIGRLRFKDLDFINRTFAIVRHKGGKTKKTILPMIDEVLALFIEQRNRFPEGDAVFRNESGDPLSAGWCTKVGNRSIKEVGLFEVTQYCMRHSICNDMNEANIATELIRQAMGHGSITTTQRYANKAKPEVLARALSVVRGGLVTKNCHQENEAVASGDTEKTARTVTV